LFTRLPRRQEFSELRALRGGRGACTGLPQLSCPVQRYFRAVLEEGRPLAPPLPPAPHVYQQQRRRGGGGHRQRSPLK